MAVRSVATTNTLEQFRTTFNSLGTDVGDLASLSGVTATSSIVAAINELASEQYAGFTISDSGSSTTQQIGANDNITFAGTSNQITATVSAQDTVTFALASSITGITSLNATTITENSVRVATQPFAIAQAVALG
jgi:pectate lyase